MEDPHARRSLDFRYVDSRLSLALLKHNHGLDKTVLELGLQVQLSPRRNVGHIHVDRWHTLITSHTAPQPQPSLTTEYTPRERGTLTKPSSTPQPASQSQTPLPPVAATPGTTEKQAEAEKEAEKDAGPDPNTLPPARAPPSHPSIDPTAVGVMDGRSILEVDLNALAEKPWRRPGSDISDWFNYGFDEISWEAYCYRRREFGDIASMLKNNVQVSIWLRNEPSPFFICTRLRTSLVCLKTNSLDCLRRCARW